MRSMALALFLIGLLVSPFSWASARTQAAVKTKSSTKSTAKSTVRAQFAKTAPEKSPWSVNATLSNNYNLKDEKAAQVLQQSLTLAFNFSENWSVGLDEVYQSPIEVDEELRDYYGFEDLELYGTYTASGFSVTAKAILPTSRTSQRATLNAGYSTEVGYRYSYGIISASVAAELLGYSYDYETADEAGTVSNIPFAQWYKGSFGVGLLKSLRWTTTYSYYAYRNYAGTNDGINRFSTGLRYMFADQFGAHLTYKSLSQTLIQSSLFDEMSQVLALGLIFSI
ncbi:MAG TPA: hypothetical protein VFV50_19020 [Bdellovibrionales bacterium]|nr:hypothetical protein [Bdellovibrionales bacterium]